MDSMITIVGNLTKDPEMKYTSSGRATARFGVAVNRRWQSNGEWQEQVSFFNVVCWQTLAENVAECCVKGTRVTVCGRLEQRSWDKDDGTKGNIVEIVADEVGASLRWATVEITRNERTDDPSAKGKKQEPEASSYDEGGDPW